MSRLDVTATRVWNDGFTTTDHSTHEWHNHTAKEAATERAARLHSAGQSVTRHGNTLTVVSEHHPSATDSYVETLVLAWTDEDGDANLYDAEVKGTPLEAITRDHAHMPTLTDHAIGVVMPACECENAVHFDAGTGCHDWDRHAEETALSEPAARWADLFGAAPNYTGGVPVDEWLEAHRD